MDNVITVENHGPLIVASNYWASEPARAARMIVSPNAGAIRCLVPAELAPMLGGLRQSQYAIASVGPWNRGHAATFGVGVQIDDGSESLEIIWEDGSKWPHVWHLTAKSCLMMPGEPGESQWVIACWVERRGAPHKAIERPCYWRRSEKLPDMRVWKK